MIMSFMKVAENGFFDQRQICAQETNQLAGRVLRFESLLAYLVAQAVLVNPSGLGGVGAAAVRDRAPHRETCKTNRLWRLSEILLTYRKVPPCGRTGRLASTFACLHQSHTTIAL